VCSNQLFFYVRVTARQYESGEFCAADTSAGQATQVHQGRGRHDPADGPRLKDLPADAAAPQ
jgi:hypothetical protein